MRSSAILASMGCGAFVAVMSSLHVLRQDISPLERGLSRYAGGDTLALATAGFLSLAGALLALRRAVWAGQKARRLVDVAAVGLVVVAATPIGNPPTLWPVEAAHTLGGLAFYLGVLGAMFSVADDPGDRWLARIMLLVLSLFFLGAAGTPGLHPIAGLLQRAVFAVAIYWIVRLCSG